MAEPAFDPGILASESKLKMRYFLFGICYFIEKEKQQVIEIIQKQNPALVSHWAAICIISEWLKLIWGKAAGGF